MQGVTMIISFGSKETELIWIGDQVKKWPVNFQINARRKLRMLSNSQNLSDLRIPLANRLEKLSGNFKSFYSIRINKQWRIIFKWNNGNAIDVKIIDYH
jgi:proteic killer suppression protein